MLIKRSKFILNIFFIISFSLSPFISSIGKIQAQEVLGVSVQATDEEKAIAYARPAVVKIFVQMCGNIVLGTEIKSLGLLDSDYDEFCLSSGGSGFIISSDGYVGTNGHVVTYDEDYVLLYSLYSKPMLELYVDIWVKIAEQETGKVYTKADKEEFISQITSSEDNLYSAIEEMYGYYVDGYFTFDMKPLEVYVQKGTNIFKTDDNYKLTNPEDHYLAEVIDKQYETPEYDEETKEYDWTSTTAGDVAILKIDANNLPTITKGNTDELNVGASVIVLGYPGKAETDFLTEESGGEVTITRGIISAVKYEYNGTNRLFQTDASLGHGNSGGPAIDKNGKVLGIATYLTIPNLGTGDEAADFNFLRDINELVTMAEKNNITLKQGEIDTDWRQGLEYFWQYKFSKALEEFNKVKALYPSHPLVQSYIDRSELGIQNGEEKKDWKDYVSKYIPEDKIPIVVVGVGSVCGGLILFMVLVLIVKKIFRRKKIPTLPQTGGQVIPQYTQGVSSQSIQNPQLSAAVQDTFNTQQSISIVSSQPSISTQSTPVMPTVNNGSVPIQPSIKPISVQSEQPVVNMDNKSIETNIPPTPTEIKIVDDIPAQKNGNIQNIKSVPPTTIQSNTPVENLSTENVAETVQTEPLDKPSDNVASIIQTTPEIPKRTLWRPKKDVVSSTPTALPGEPAPQNEQKSPVIDNSQQINIQPTSGQAVSNMANKPPMEEAAPPIVDKKVEFSQPVKPPVETPEQIQTQAPPDFDEAPTIDTSDLPEWLRPV